MTTPVLIVLILLLAFAVWLGITRWLSGADMRQWDDPSRLAQDAAAEEQFAARADGQSSEQRIVLETLAKLLGDIARVPYSKRLAQMRSSLDAVMDGRSFACRFVAADAAGVRAEWVLAPDADPNRRTLYIHGGAYTAGSPKREVSTRSDQAHSDHGTCSEAISNRNPSSTSNTRR